MLVNLNDVLVDARRNHYGVGLFNTVNLEMAKGVLAAAEETKSPVIIGTAEVLLPFANLDELAYFLVPMAKKASVPVVLHFDHGYTPNLIRHAIDIGFSSVMYDCSTMEFADNMQAVSDMTKYAHARGVTVEGELGHVGANEGAAEATGEHGNLYTDPADAKIFVDATDIDALAVAIGTAHGAYKAKPKLDFKRLDEIAAAVPTPLVLHGGSGLTKEDFQTAIAGGIAKVNIFTDINCAQAQSYHDHFKAGMGITDLMLDGIEAVKEATAAKMHIFNSVNRA